MYLSIESSDQTDFQADYWSTSKKGIDWDSVIWNRLDLFMLTDCIKTFWYSQHQLKLRNSLGKLVG